MSHLAANFTSFWTRLIDAATRSSGAIGDGDLAGASGHEALGKRLSELTRSYCRGLSELPEGAGSPTARAATGDAASLIDWQIRQLQLGGGEAFASYGAAIASAASAASASRGADDAGRPSASLAGGLLALQLAKAAQAGRWREIGKMAAAVGASSHFGATATVSFAMAIAAVGALGPPSSVGTLVLSAAAAFGDRWEPLGFGDRDAIGRLLTLWLESSARSGSAAGDGEPEPASTPLCRDARADARPDEVRSCPPTSASSRRRVL